MSPYNLTEPAPKRCLRIKGFEKAKSGYHKRRKALADTEHTSANKIAKK